MIETDEEKNVEDLSEISNEKSSLIAKFGWILFGFFIVLMMIYGVVKILRDQNPSEVAKRFVQNNETIKQETGGIVRIQGFGKRIVQGKNWETSAKIFGNENNIEVSVNGYCGEGSSDELGGCSILTAKFRDANDVTAEWQEIEIGWFEKQMLVFK